MYNNMQMKCSDCGAAMAPPPAAPPHPVPLSRLWRIADTTINPVLMKVLKPFLCFERVVGGGRKAGSPSWWSEKPSFLILFEFFERFISLPGFSGWCLCSVALYFCLRLHILQLAGCWQLSLFVLTLFSHPSKVIRRWFYTIIPVNTTDSWTWGELRIRKQQLLTWSKNRWIIVRVGVDMQSISSDLASDYEYFLFMAAY